MMKSSPSPLVCAALLLCCLVLPTPALAAGELPRDIVTAGELAAEWQTAPLYGADVRSLGFSPADPTTVLAGTSAGQVYLSRDSGGSWTNAGSPLPFPGWVIGDLHFDRNRAGRVWASLWRSTGEGQLVYSDDLGGSWHDGGLDPVASGQVYTVQTVAGQPGQVFAGTRWGVFATADDGHAWASLTLHDPEIVTVYSLLIAGAEGRTIVAGTWRQAYRSTDGGATWQPAFDGMFYDTHLFSLHPVPGQPGEVWTSTCGWVYKSENLGRSWQRFTNGFENRRVQSFQVLPDRLLAGTSAGVYASADDGRSWRRHTAPDLAVWSLAHHPDRPERVLAGTEGTGVWVSDDGGLSFKPSSHGMTNLRVPALAARNGELLVAVSYAGPASGLYRLDGESGGFVREATELPTVQALAFAADVPYAGTEQGLFARRDGKWQPLPELRKERIEELVPAGDRLAIRMRFRQLWQTGKGLVPLGDEPFPTVVAPPAAGTRLFATGDARFSAVALDRRGPALYDGHLDRWLRISLPFSDVYLASAAVHHGRLYLGTVGYGLIWTELPSSVDEPGEAVAATAAAGD